MDTETTSLDPMRAHWWASRLPSTPHEAAYLPLAHHYAGVPQQLDCEHTLQRLKPWLENPARAKLGQNLKYDTHIFANHGIALRGIVHDTLLQSYVLESHKPHDMDSLASRHLGVKTMTYAEVAGKGAKQIGFDEVDLDTATRYAAEDADITLQLHHALYPQISRDAQAGICLPRHRNAGVASAVSRGTQWRADRQQPAGKAEPRAGEKSCWHWSRAPTSWPGSRSTSTRPSRFRKSCSTSWACRSRRKPPAATPSTDEDVLQQLALDYPLPKLLLEYRGLAKLKSTYTDKLPRMVDPANRARAHQL